MKLTELQEIMKNNNSNEELEKHLLHEILEKEKSYNPFNTEQISRKLILTAIIHCTVILASLIYLTGKNREVNN